MFTRADNEMISWSLMDRKIAVELFILVNMDLSYCHLYNQTIVGTDNLSSIKDDKKGQHCTVHKSTEK